MERKRIPLSGLDGILGWIHQDELPAANQAGRRTEVVIWLEDDRTARIPGDLLEKRSDGTYSVPLRRDQLRVFIQSARQERSSELVIPVLSEELEVTKQRVTQGRVQISKQVQEREEVLDVPVLSEEVQVERVPVDRLVDTPPEIRYEGETMVIPVLEEVLVVEKRLRVKEEVRVTRIQKALHETKRVTLREESVDVHRAESNKDH